MVLSRSSFVTYHIEHFPYALSLVVVFCLVSWFFLSQVVFSPSSVQPPTHNPLPQPPMPGFQAPSLVLKVLHLKGYLLTHVYGWMEAHMAVNITYGAQRTTCRN